MQISIKDSFAHPGVKGKIILLYKIRTTCRCLQFPVQGNWSCFQGSRIVKPLKLKSSLHLDGLASYDYDSGEFLMN